MKPCVVWVLFLTSVFPLFAQTNDGFLMYLPPVTGTGSAPEDNEIFTDVLAMELGAWNFKVVDEPSDAVYSLIATLAPPGTYYEEDAEEKSFLSLALNKNGITLYEQGAYYTSAENANSYIPFLLYNMLSNVFIIQENSQPSERIVIVEVEKEQPQKPGGDGSADTNAAPASSGDWNYQPWYFGLGVFWNPRLYYGDRLSSSLANFAFAFTAEFHFFEYLCVGTGIDIATDWVVASRSPGDDHRNTILQIPLLVKFVWRHGVNYMHEPYIGALLNIPLYHDTTPALFSWTAGFQFGMKAGKGVMYADTHYAMDFTPSGLHKKRPSDTRRYRRYMIYLGVGYKYNLVDSIAKALKAYGENLRREKAVEQPSF